MVFQIFHINQGSRSLPFSTALAACWGLRLKFSPRQECPEGLLEHVLKREGHALCLPFPLLVGWNLSVKAGAEAALCYHEVYMPKMVKQYCGKWLGVWNHTRFNLPTSVLYVHRTEINWFPFFLLSFYFVIYSWASQYISKQKKSPRESVWLTTCPSKRAMTWSQLSWLEVQVFSCNLELLLVNSGSGVK